MIKGSAPAALPRIGVLERLVDRLPVVAPELLAWLYGALLVGLLAGHEGGFLATSWGWCALVTLWLAAVALLVQERIQIGVEGLAFLGGLLAFLVWVALSNLWTTSQTATMHEVQRDLAYFGIAAATVAIANRDTIARIAGGAATAVFFLSIYGLLTRVAPDHFGAFDSTSYGYRLSPPITYWNGLGLFAAMGFLLMLGFARRGHGILVRAAAAFTLPALAVTLYFTFSRGAWIALGCGFLVLLAVTVERVKLVLAVAALAPWCVFALRSAHARPALITVGSSYTNAVQQGHSLLLVLLVLSVCSGVSAAVLALATHRFHVPSAAEKAFSAALVVAALAAVGALFVHYGSPTQVAKSTWHQFTGVPKQTGDNVSARVFQLSSNGRVEIWRTALRAFQRHPVFGNGAGTFYQLWAASPSAYFRTTQAHSIYFQSLAELGVPGLVLLVAALVAPLVAAVRARRRRLVPAAVAAYVAFLVHAGVDWDWQLAGVTAVAVILGGCLVAAPPTTRRLRLSVRITAALLLAILALAAVPGIIADHALAAGRAALQTNPTAAARDARQAARWAPWSSDPAELLGDADLAKGERRAARVAYRRAARRDPRNWQLWVELANVSLGKAREDALRTAHRLNPHLALPRSP